MVGILKIRLCLDIYNETYSFKLATGFEWTITGFIFFKKIGDIKSCKVVIDKYTQISKGFGFVEMTSNDDGEMAIKELHGTKIGKNKIRIKQSNDQ